MRLIAERDAMNRTPRAAGATHWRMACRRLPADEPYPAGRTLLVCIGPDSALMLDLAALRAVRSATGLKFQRTARRHTAQVCRDPAP